MIKIKPDKEGFLTQWDIDRKVVISGLDGIEGVKVHFASPDDDHGAYVVDPVEQDGTVYADVPNILLTEPGRVDVFVYTTYTRVRAALMVFPREKPDDYVYTETEVWRYEKFVEQLNGKEDTANRVTTVDDNSDDEHYPTTKAVYKAIPKSLKNPYSLTFTGAVTGSYDGSKPMTFNIPVGSSGTDISLGLTGASVGDIVKVKAVDDSGKPTAWEALQMASGGVATAGNLLYDAVLEEDASFIITDFDTELSEYIVIIGAVVPDAGIISNVKFFNTLGSDYYLKISAGYAVMSLYYRIIGNVFWMVRDVNYRNNYDFANITEPPGSPSSHSIANIRSGVYKFSDKAKGLASSATWPAGTHIWIYGR